MESVSALAGRTGRIWQIGCPGWAGRIGRTKKPAQALHVGPRIRIQHLLKRGKALVGRAGRTGRTRQIGWAGCAGRIGRTKKPAPALYVGARFRTRSFQQFKKQTAATKKTRNRNPKKTRLVRSESGGGGHAASAEANYRRASGPTHGRRCTRAAGLPGADSQ